MKRDITITHPDVARQWDHSKNNKEPEYYTAGSTKKVWWLCDHGHSWEAAVSKRTLGSGCPYCSNRKILVGFNDFATTYPDIAKQWDYIKNDKSPQEVFAGSRYKAWWICPEGHSYQQILYARTKQNQQCPYCAGQKAVPDVNDITVTHKEIVDRFWDYENNVFLPQEFSAGSNKVVWWVCTKGHSYQQSIRRKVSGRCDCPICSNNRTVSGYNDAATSYKDFIDKHWDYEKNSIDPTTINAGSEQKAFWICDEGHSYQQRINCTLKRGYSCPVCSTMHSNKEDELSEWIRTVVPEDIDIILNDRSVLGELELDIYIPEKKIAIEFNGVHWHNEKMGKDRDYHYNKWKTCQDKGIQLITVWEDEWDAKKHVVLSMIAHKIGVSNVDKIYARKTFVDTIVPVSEARAFCQQNHIQGFASGTYYVGLRSKESDGLVAVSVWRKNKDVLYLDRYCTKENIVGGLGKILKQVKIIAREQGISKLITFSDNCVSDGGLYRITGFTQETDLKPDYRYVLRGVRYHKFNYRKKRFKEDSNLIFKEGLTEKQLAEINNLYRIWDCGKTRWVINV